MPPRGRYVPHPLRCVPLRRRKAHAAGSCRAGIARRTSLVRGTPSVHESPRHVPRFGCADGLRFAAFGSTCSFSFIPCLAAGMKENSCDGLSPTQEDVLRGSVVPGGDAPITEFLVLPAWEQGGRETIKSQPRQRSEGRRAAAATAMTRASRSRSLSHLTCRPAAGPLLRAAGHSEAGGRRERPRGGIFVSAPRRSPDTDAVSACTELVEVAPVPRGQAPRQTITAPAT